MSGSDTFNLPQAPPELCFDQNEFVKKSFSVDEFLHQHKNASGLETMRDDLGVYLKVLRSAMIELINEDYADFVNLSSNLVGLDQSIAGIQSPLSQLREEIVTVKTTLTDTMAELQKCLDDKRKFRAHQKCVHSAAKVAEAIEKMEDLLHAEHSDEILLERCALEYVQIAFDMQFCEESSAEAGSKLRPGKIQELHRNLIDRIEKHFLSTLHEQNIERLERCLRIFCTLDECHVAEQIFRREVVGKHMNTIIAESALQNSPQGLEGIYKQILAFIEEKMIPLMTLTRLREDGMGHGLTYRVKGFDFIINSYWVEVEQRLETHMSSIFAPGNPDQFYQKFQHSVQFLKQLEEVIGSDEGVARFKDHEQYKSFQTRWNLPVYFQIRFQEIGGALENALSRPFDSNLIQSTTDKPSFIPIYTTITCIRKCWSDGIYLPQLFIRFLKLTLQILSRTSHWIENFSKVAVWPNSDTSLVDVFVLLYIDVVRLSDELPGFLATIQTQLEPHLKEHLHLVEKCLDDSKQALQQRLDIMSKRLVKEIVIKSTPNVKQVSDIPRLFRKTNRDIPSKASAYVHQMLEPSIQFFNKYQKQIDSTILRVVLVDILSDLNKQYYSAVDDVLTSVQKTEESLRRLKNLREKNTSVAATDTIGAADQRTGMTDDDKIRLQLQVDVVHWSTCIEQVGVVGSQVQQLDELIALVEQSSPLRCLNK